MQINAVSNLPGTSAYSIETVSHLPDLESVKLEEFFCTYFLLNSRCCSFMSLESLHSAAEFLSRCDMVLLMKSLLQHALCQHFP